MSFTESLSDLIPALKGTGRRRAVDKLAEVRDDLAKALTFLHEAGDEIALLHNDVTDAHRKQAEAEEIVVQQLANLDDLHAENDQLHAELAALKARFAVELAAEANATAIDVPPMVRPVDGPEDEATAPIDVRPLWAARDAGLLGPVTDRGNDDTQPLPAA
ncbi:hypothetical protein [Streptomyces prasinopilosus]|uniref:hypothetical protein n=1 Tax=Streptomyces prasinopilosus TaxID=67344 RepID=UPI0006EB8FE5|nr:hypothetical protein [Streptomyces prasinopilosus]